MAYFFAGLRLERSSSQHHHELVSGTRTFMLLLRCRHLFHLQPTDLTFFLEGDHVNAQLCSIKPPSGRNREIQLSWQGGGPDTSQATAFLNLGGYRRLIA